MKRTVAALMLLVVGAACRESALASGKDRDPMVALCASAHGVPHVLLAYHHQRYDRDRAMDEMTRVRKTIENNASGRYGAHLRDVAAAIHVLQVVTMHHGDTNDAYRDLRTLREALPQPACPKAPPRAAKRP